MNHPVQAVPDAAAACPGKAHLSDYLLGLSDESTSSSIDSHLEFCSTCNELVRQLETELLPTLDRLEVTTDENHLIQAAIAASQLKSVPSDFEWRSYLLAQVPEQVGPYRLIRAIGRGGMSSVYQAKHQKLGKEVAVKILPLGVASSFAVERFEREIQAAGKLHHAAIVNATDAGADNGVLYLAMELVHGFDLGKVAKSHAPLQIADVCEIGRQVAMGLSHAHQMGMVHRDIKPSNIMLDRQGNVKVLDFGLVLLNQWDSPLGELTTVGQFLGTLDYMAPEQAERSAAVDHRSDLYSLGATLFRLLTGQLPVAMLPNQSPLEKLRVLSDHKPLKLQTLRPEVPNDLANAIDSLLKTDPKARPESAAHVAEALQPFSCGSDLHRLAELATASAATSPQDPLAVPLPLRRALAAGNSLATSDRSKHRLLWMISLGLLPLLAYLGWTFIVESDQGNLVIESEAPDVQLHVKKIDGTGIKNLTIEHGTSITRLRSGDYEIKLDSPSDGVVIEPDKIVLQQGETAIARIRYKSLATTVLTTSDDGLPTNWLPDGVISVDLLRATYKDKSVRDHLKQIYLERDYTTWLNSLAILHAAIPPNDKPKLAPFVLECAERKRFLHGLHSLYLVGWLPYEQLDARIADWLGNGDDRFISLLVNCTAKTSGKAGTLPATLPAVDWTKLPKTWQQVEAWLTDDPNMTRRQRLQQTRWPQNSLQVHPVATDEPLNQFLFTNYPATALELAEYYVYPDYSTGLSSSESFLPRDPELKRIRIEARLKVTQAAIGRGNVQDLLRQLQTADSRAADEEKEFWKLSAHFIGQRLERWAESNDSLLQDRVQIQFSQEQSSWSIVPESAKQSYEWGGRGGYTMGLPPGTVGKVSESLELLGAYQRLPKSLRPTDALTKVRAMLASKDRALNQSLQRIFDSDWQRLAWDADMRLTHKDEFGNKDEIDAADQKTAVALIMNRWVEGLLESDFIDPSEVVSRFFQAASDSQASSNGQPIDHWLHSKVQAKWAQAKNDFLSVFGSQERDSFNVSMEQKGLKLATVTGKLRHGPTIGPVDIDIQLELELEREGWRIQSIKRFIGGRRVVLFE